MRFDAAMPLVRQFFFRNLVVIAMFWLILFAASLLTSVPWIATLIGSPDDHWRSQRGFELGYMTPRLWLLAAISSFVVSIVAPLLPIATTLLYYDCRVRKEHYDVRGLTQDLLR